MAANFTPDLVGYTEQKELKFWCQKVLPLVYDDSLSYMELLCKVITYLNNCISDIDLLRQEIEDLKESDNSGG